MLLMYDNMVVHELIQTSKKKNLCEMVQHLMSPKYNINFTTANYLGQQMRWNPLRLEQGSS